MIWNLALHIGAGYFGSDFFEMTLNGILKCAATAAIIQGIDLFRHILGILKTTKGHMEPYTMGVISWKAFQTYIMKILFYGSVTLFVASLFRA